MKLLEGLFGGPVVTEDAADGLGDVLGIGVLENVASHRAADGTGIACDLHAGEQFFVADEGAACEDDGSIARANDFFERFAVARPVDFDNVRTQFGAEARVCVLNNLRQIPGSLR